MLDNLTHRTNQKLWLLEAREDLPSSEDPWVSPWGRCFAMVIRAPSEKDARQFAQKHGDLEVDYYPPYSECWTNPKFSTCVELTTKGETEVILKDVREG